jgi:hypothetical protein
VLTNTSLFDEHACPTPLSQRQLDLQQALQIAASTLSQCHDFIDNVRGPCAGQLLEGQQMSLNG